MAGGEPRLTHIGLQDVELTGQDDEEWNAEVAGLEEDVTNGNFSHFAEAAGTLYLCRAQGREDLRVGVERAELGDRRHTLAPRPRLLTIVALLLRAAAVLDSCERNKVQR